MRIVVTNSNNDIAIGLLCALQHLEHQCTVWDKRQKPVFDMFDEMKPDIFICGTGDVDETIVQALEEYTNTQVIFFGFGAPPQLKPALICYPHTLADSQIKIINQHNLPYVKLAPAANLAQFGGGTYREKYSSDILYLSDNPNINPAVAGVFANLIQDFRLRVIGPARLPIPYFVGNAPLDVICDNIKSTKLGLDFMDKHIYDYAINKIFCMSFDSSTVVPQLTPENFGDEIRKYMASDKLRNKHIKEAFDLVVNGHTYYHRVKTVFDMLGHEEIGKAALSKLEKVLAQ